MSKNQTTSAPAPNAPVVVDDGNMAPTVESLQAIVNEQLATIAQLNATIAAQTALIAELTEKLEGGKPSKVIVKVGKKKFKVLTNPGYVPKLGKHLSADDLADDSDDLKTLVEIGAGCLEEVK